MSTTRTYDVKRADDRGLTNLGWLHSRHSFSFGQYVDRNAMGFRSLRVINDDVVAPGGGFGEHDHQDMEILTWVLSGGLKHGDSLGHGDVIRPGELQAMSAGSGIRHSEMNASDSAPVHFLQIWIMPDRAGHAPTYRQKEFAPESYHNQWKQIAGTDGDALPIHQDARLYVANIDAGTELAFDLPPGRHAWLHVAEGSVNLDGLDLASGDAVSTSEAGTLSLKASTPSQVLMFDLA